MTPPPPKQILFQNGISEKVEMSGLNFPSLLRVVLFFVAKHLFFFNIHSKCKCTESYSIHIMCQKILSSTHH